ncbi:MAG TPA: orotate phosphoribosyltransferase [Terriglobales bacterium]|nr:orotate phosphoribosyltransferase [Terriglobales bacterium]
MSPRDQLLRLLAEKSFRLGEFTLSSGAKSDYYVDCRTTTLDAEGAKLVGAAFLDEIRARGWHPEAVGGMTLGADPIAVAVAVLAAESNAPIHAFLVRKAEKKHGTAQRIEGFRRRGARVVIVDDVCTTGTSILESIAAAREAGFQIAGVMCLVEREEAGGREAVERAAAPAPFLALFRAAEVRNRRVLLESQQAGIR